MKRPRVWIEQMNEHGDLIYDYFLHSECDYLRQWDSRDEWLKEVKQEQKEARWTF